MSLLARLQVAQTVDQVFDVLVSELTSRLGEANVRKLFVALGVVSVIFVVYVVRGIFALLSSPSRPTKSLTAPRVEKRPVDKKDAPTPTDKAATIPVKLKAVSSPAAIASRRTRVATNTECSVLKGVSLPGSVKSSPDGVIIVAASRDKRWVRVYPQYTGLHRDAKTFKDFVTLGEVPAGAVITDVLFSDAGGIFALLDGIDGTVFTFRYTFDTDAAKQTLPKVSISFTGTVSIPAHFLAERYDDSVLADDGKTVLLLFCKEGLLEAFDLSAGQHVGSARVKAGNSAAWCHASGLRVAAAGSYIHDCRASHVVLRAGQTSGAVSLSKYASVPCATRASRISMTGDGSFLIIQLSGSEGILQVWSLDVAFNRDEEPVLVSEFRDVDFADATSLFASCYASSSTTRLRELLVVITRGSDAVVYRFDRAHEAKSSSAFSPKLVCEIHEAHDGEPIRWAGIACRGEALMTCSETDSRNVIRLWPFVCTS